MQFHRLSPDFYAAYGQCPEMLQKHSRPYYVLVLTVDAVTYAIPLRSHISHPFCFIADGNTSGLDFTKAVVVTEQKYVDAAPVTIRSNEFRFLAQREHEIGAKFAAYVGRYKKECRRRAETPSLPESNLCKYSTLKYFHKELGLPAYGTQPAPTKT
jgi:protein AbiQ